MKALMADFSIGREVWDRLRSKVLRQGGSSNGLSLELVEIPEPEPLSSQWVKIRTIMSGISDMDLGMIVNCDPSPLGGFVSFPFVPGNENLGIVTDCGDDVKGIELGERVVVNPLLSCEPRGIEPLCASCARGQPSACRHFSQGVLSPGMIIGACRDTGGGWADSFVAHKSQVRTLPQSMESGQAILIPELTRALRAVLQNPPSPGDRVMVVGGGSLGLLLMESFRLLGHQGEIWLAVEHPFEMDVARNLGYRDVVMFHGAGAAYEEIAEALEAKVHFPQMGRVTLEGGADLVYETTGLKQCIEDALNFTAEGKKVVLVGMSEPSGLDLGPVWFKDVSISGTTFSGTETFEGEITTTFDVAMELVTRNDLPSDKLVTHEFKLEDYRNAVSVLADRGPHKAVKAIFRHVV